MSPVHPARRRAVAFDAAIESGSTVGLDARTAELLELVGGLRAAGAASVPVARPAYVAGLRERLVLAAETELVAAPAEPRRSLAAPTRTRHERRLAVALGGLAVVGATTSMAVASQSALPGEVLYPVKRALEDAGTGLAADSQRGPGLLEHASARLAELDELSLETGGDGTVEPATEQAMQGALDTFADQADEASEVLLARFADSGDEGSVSALKRFTATSLDSLVVLEAELPDAVRPAVLHAAEVLVVIDQAAAEACPECAGSGITQLPPSLLSAQPLDRAGESRAEAPAAAAPAEERRETGRRRGGSTETPAPTASQAPDAETSVAPPRTSGAPAPSTDAKPPKVEVNTSAKPGGKVREDVGDVLGGITGTTPSTPPPDLGEVLGDAVDDVDDLTDPLTDPLLP